MRLETRCELICFVSSSGHCNLDCRYCIVQPVAKRQPSLTFEDLKFLLDRAARSAFLAFSGLGDFFAGYSKQDRFLSRILDLEVEIALDVNGSAVRELAELRAAELERIRFVNLTMHYQQLKEKGLLDRWAANARWLHAAKGEVLLQGYVLSPLLAAEWEEALRYYERAVFARTGKQLTLVRDIRHPFDGRLEARVAELAERHAHLVEGVHQEDFAALFSGRGAVLCPAGQNYFRIWNDGRVQGCPNLPEVAELGDCGNLKERRLHLRPEPFHCRTPQYCDCHVIEGLGRMGVAEDP